MGWRLWTVVSIVVLVVVFTLQNRERIELTFLFWDVELPRVAMLTGFFVAGMSIGWISATIGHLRARAEAQDERARPD